MPKRGVAFVTKAGWGKTKKAKLSKGVSAKQVQAAVKKAIMKTAEIKEITGSQGLSQVTLGGQVFCLNQIAEGTEINQRVGRHLTPKGCDVIVLVNNDGVTTDRVDGAYVALVWDKQPDNSTPAYSTIMDTASSSIPALSFKNTLQYRDRFQILWEERSLINDFTASSNNFENTYYRKYVDLSKRDTKCEYLNASAATPSTGGLYLIACTNNQAAGPGNCLFAYSAKFTYTDF